MLIATKTGTMRIFTRFRIKNDMLYSCNSRINQNITIFFIVMNINTQFRKRFAKLTGNMTVWTWITVNF